MICLICLVLNARGNYRTTRVLRCLGPADRMSEVLMWLKAHQVKYHFALHILINHTASLIRYFVFVSFSWAVFSVYQSYIWSNRRTEKKIIGYFSCRHNSLKSRLKVHDITLLQYTIVCKQHEHGVSNHSNPSSGIDPIGQGPLKVNFGGHIPNIYLEWDIHINAPPNVWGLQS